MNCVKNMNFHKILIWKNGSANFPNFKEYQIVLALIVISFVISQSSTRVAHFLVFQFPVGKREKWPISWSGNTRKSGKFFTVTRMSKFWVDFAKILKTIELGPIVIFANGKSFLDGTQMLVYSQNWNFGQFLQHFSPFWSQPGNFPGKVQFPGGNFLVSHFLFPGFLPGNVQL